MRRERFGGLDAVLTGGPDRAGGGDGPLVILLHGFGAPGDDLVPLWRVLDVPRETRFLFPAAPLAMPGYVGGRAWWMIDFERLERLMSGHPSISDEEAAREIPEGLAEARALVSALVDEAAAKLGASKLVLGGFSQGAMLACDVTLRREAPPAALVMLSGTLIAAHEWSALAPRRRGLPVFQSHGLKDPLLPFAAAERLRDLLEGAGLPVEFVPFHGGHEIPGGVLDRLGAFLAGALA